MAQFTTEVFQNEFLPDGIVYFSAPSSTTLRMTRIWIRCARFVPNCM